MLNQSGFEYMFTGAVASSYYGRPRTTVDIDIVVRAQEEELVTLARWLRKADLKAQERKMRAALESGYGIVTIEDKKSPHTLDVIFSSRKLQRRAGRVLGILTYYQTPESLILAKLRMLKVTVQPERAAADREDIRAILASTKVDVRSLRKGAEAEGTAGILRDLTS